MNSEEYISAVEKDYSYGYTQQKGRWHGEEQNEMRVYQRYGGMLRNFIRNSYPSDMVPVIDRDYFIRNFPAEREGDYPRTLSATDSLMLSINSEMMNFGTPLYLSSKDIEKRGFKVLKSAEPVPLYDKATGKAENYYNVDQTDMQATDYEGYAYAVALAWGAQSIDGMPAKADWSNVFELLDDEWHCKVREDGSPGRKDAARYDKATDTVLVPGRDIMDRDSDRFKDSFLTALRDSLSDSGRVPVSEKTREASGSLARLMDAVRYDIDLFEDGIPDMGTLHEAAASGRLDDPRYVKEALDSASALTEAVSGRALYVNTGIRDSLSDELIKEGQSKPSWKEGAFEGKSEEAANPVETAPEKQDDKAQRRSSLSL